MGRTLYRHAAYQSSSCFSMPMFFYYTEVMLNLETKIIIKNILPSVLLSCLNPCYSISKQLAIHSCVNHRTHNFSLSTLHYYFTCKVSLSDNNFSTYFIRPDLVKGFNERAVSTIILTILEPCSPVGIINTIWFTIVSRIRYDADAILKVGLQCFLLPHNNVPAVFSFKKGIYQVCIVSRYCLRLLTASRLVK